MWNHREDPQISGVIEFAGVSTRQRTSRKAGVSHRSKNRTEIKAELSKKVWNVICFIISLELEVIQSQMTQKPVLRGEVGARVRGTFVVRRKKRCWRARVVQGAWVRRRVLRSR